MPVEPVQIAFELVGWGAVVFVAKWFYWDLFAKDFFEAIKDNLHDTAENMRNSRRTDTGDKLSDNRCGNIQASSDESLARRVVLSSDRVRKQ